MDDITKKEIIRLQREVNRLKMMNDNLKRRVKHEAKWWALFADLLKDRSEQLEQSPARGQEDK